MTTSIELPVPRRAPMRRRLAVPSPRDLAIPHRLALTGVTLVSIFCNFWMLGQNGYGNLYYAAAVKSMGSNLHAFFFTSFDSAGATTMVGNADPTNATDAKLIAYLEANQGTATYLVATPSSNTADTIILATGKPVMALGGFTGTDPILTSAQLQALIAAGKVRYFLLNGGNTRAGIASSGSGSGASSAVINVGGPNGNTNTAVLWVEQNCATVATSAWQSSTSGARATGGGVAGMGGAQQLYDCAAK